MSKSYNHAWENRDVQKILTHASNAVGGDDTTNGYALLSAAFDDTTLSTKWKDRMNQVGSKELPQDFIDSIALPNHDPTLTSRLKNDGIQAFGSGTSQRKNFENWLHKNLNIVDLDESRNDSTIAQVHSYFDRYYSIYPDSELTDIYHYIFMTRPDCNLIDNFGVLYNEVKRDPVIENVYKTRPHVLKNLIAHGVADRSSPYYIPGNHRFMPMITSRCDSLQLPNTELRTSSLQQPYTRYTQHYGLHTAGHTGIEFTMNFREFSDLSIHYLMTTWIHYVNDVMKGVFNPKHEYIIQNRADYMVSIYDIMCAPDATSILYWVKITGAFPTENDNSDLSFNLHGRSGNQISIPFVAYRIDPIHPYSLIDFNFNAGITNHNIGSNIKNCSPTSSMVQNLAAKASSVIAQSDNIWTNQYQTGYALRSRPFIYWDKTMKIYKLGWQGI